MPGTKIRQAGRAVFWRRTDLVLVPGFFDGWEEDKFLAAMLLRRNVIRQKFRDKFQSQRMRGTGAGALGGQP